MTRDEGFLRRWARRKQAVKAAETVERAETAEVQVPDSALLPVALEPERAPEPAAARNAVPEASPEPDLPPLESLTALSDFTAFLQKGVSAEVQSRALRVAWESDERIAGFRGMAEYAWDFNAPGYGKLWAVDDVAKMVRETLRGAIPPEPDEVPAPGNLPPGGPPPRESPPEESIAVAEAPVDPVPVVAEDAGRGEAMAALPEPGAAAPDEIAPRTAGVRRHGSALPG